jgi:N-methylhydantoinase A/oxoprolinase/acetone carboxylase beta subunit
MVAGATGSIGPLYRIGCDVGGTNSDAAILDMTALSSPSRGVMATSKSPTTPNITSGIHAAIASVLTASGADRSRVLSVTIGTTHFINALVEADARRLTRVAAVRLCGPFTRQIPPFADFPRGLRRVVDGGAYFLDGGLEIDGREIKCLDDAQIADAVCRIRQSGVKAVALVGVFSPLDHAGLHEETVRRNMLEMEPTLDIVCSHGLGGPGLLERENATILNAAILATAKRTVRGFQAAMRQLRLKCPLYISQNDGTLIDAAGAAEYPIKTFMSGPTNSMTGAAFLAGLDKPGAVSAKGDTTESQEPPHQVLIVDIGGTTTDVCALLPSGFPRQAPNFVEVGGVRTAFSMPEVVSIGLGGGSKISTDAVTGEVAVGPDSVGHRLTEEAFVFGGRTLTSSDIVVAAGQAQLGNPELVAGGIIPASTLDAAQAKIKKMLESVIDQMKVSAAPVHALLVGGGSILAPEHLDGVAVCSRPIHHDAANAVGAAIAKVAGEVDIIEILDGRDEKAVVAEASQKAILKAIRQGAAADDVKVVAVEKIPLQYTSNKATRLVIKAVGRLATPDEETLGGLAGLESGGDADVEDDTEEDAEEGEKVGIPDALEPTTKPSLDVNIETYRPTVKDGVWYISEVDLEFIATGTGVLGTGGGGPSYHEFLKGLHILRSGGAGKMRVVSPQAMKDSDLVCFGSWYGAPSVINERIAGGEEIATGIEALNKILGNKSFDALLTDEM